MNVCNLKLTFFWALRPPMLAEAENFTVLIKNSIQYPKFNFNKYVDYMHFNISAL